MREKRVGQLLVSAIEAAQRGERGEANVLLRQVIEADPQNETAWFWLAGVADYPREAQAALNQVERLNPDHPQLADARRWIQQKGSVEGSQPVDAVMDSLGETGHDAGNVDALDLSSQPIGEDGRPAQLPGSSRRRRKWSLVSGVVLATAIAFVLVLLFWAKVGTSLAEPPATPTPDLAQRIQSLQPELNLAITESRWEDAIAVLQLMRALDPDSTVLRRSAANVHYQQALGLRDAGSLDEALVGLDEALSLDPEFVVAEKERDLLSATEEGRTLYEAGDWEGAVEALSAVYLKESGYLDAANLLYKSYFKLGLAQQEAGNLTGAQDSYLSAADLAPRGSEAAEKLQEVANLLVPPTPTATFTPVPTPTPMSTPTPTPKPKLQRIDVDISDQRMYVYDGNDLVWDWIVSTGEPGKDTATGNYAIKSKVAMAYASTWDLDMPWWLGIYQSGPFENGIHGLPVQRASGQKLWGGYLGIPVSYGCVILSDENAETLFNWVEIGTPINIRW